MTLTGVVNGSVSGNETHIREEIQRIYGVNDSDVTIVTDYFVSGQFSVSSSLSEEEILEAIKQKLLELGLHQKDIALSIENGVVSYNITSESYDEAASLLAQFQDVSILDELSSEGVLVTEVQTIPDGVVARVTVTVETTGGNGKGNISNDFYWELFVLFEVSLTQKVKWTSLVKRQV